MNVVRVTLLVVSINIELPWLEMILKGTEGVDLFPKMMSELWKLAPSSLLF